MADSEKPFACPSPGCNMSFINEDHLTVHKKRHDMILNFESNNKNVFVDQTPTPTRFIKNCEELGLFQDLQNVNPFDETFRRAVEAGKTGASVSDTDISDDTLHTPHIFPHITDCQVTNGQIIHTASAIDELSSAPVATVLDVAKNDLLDSSRNDNHLPDENVFQQIDKTNESIIYEKKDKFNQESGINKRTNQSSPQSLSINGEDVQLLLKTANGKLMQLTAFPVNESVECHTPIAAGDRDDFTDVLSSERKLSTVVIKTNPPLKCSKKPNPPRLSLAKLKLKEVLTKGTDTEVDQSRRISTENDRDEDGRTVLSKKSVGTKRGSGEQNKKQELRERNRASSMRCRAKRKEWIQQLQRTISCANEKNAALQLEIKNLHTEIARLKTLLLAHKDCPVTKAMEKGDSVLIGPKVINMNPEIVQVVPQVAVNAQLPVVSLSSTPSLAKKRRFATASPSSKSTFILRTPEIQTELQTAVLNRITPIVQIATSNDVPQKLNSSKLFNLNNAALSDNSALKDVNKVVIQD